MTAGGGQTGQILAEVRPSGLAGTVLLGLLLRGQRCGTGWRRYRGAGRGLWCQRWGVKLGFEEVALAASQHPLRGGQRCQARFGGFGAHLHNVAVRQRVFAVALALGVEQADGVGIHLASGQRRLETKNGTGGGCGFGCGHNGRPAVRHSWRAGGGFFLLGLFKPLFNLFLVRSWRVGGRQLLRGGRATGA